MTPKRRWSLQYESESHNGNGKGKTMALSKRWTWGAILTQVVTIGGLVDWSTVADSPKKLAIAVVGAVASVVAAAARGLLDAAEDDAKDAEP